MLDINEVLNIELLDDYIDQKNNLLNETITTYNDLCKRYKSFVKEYNEGLNSLSDTLTKKIENMHKMVDTFYSQYEALISKINDLEKSLNESDSRFNGDITKEVQDKLLTKLKSELESAKSNVKKMLDTYIEDFENSQKLLEKSISKLEKLRGKVINNINN